MVCMCETGLYVWEWFVCVIQTIVCVKWLCGYVRMVCMCGNGLDVWEWFGCVKMVCMCEDGLYVWEWFGCVGSM